MLLMEQGYAELLTFIQRLTQWVVNKKEVQIHGQWSFKSLLILSSLRTERLSPNLQKGQTYPLQIDDTKNIESC